MLLFVLRLVTGDVFSFVLALVVCVGGGCSCWWWLLPLVLRPGSGLLDAPALIHFNVVGLCGVSLSSLHHIRSRWLVRPQLNGTACAYEEYVLGHDQAGKTSETQPPTKKNKDQKTNHKI